MGSDAKVKNYRGVRSVTPNGAWLTKQVQMRAWRVADLASACADLGTPVGTTTLGRALRSLPVDRTTLGVIMAAFDANAPIIPEEAIA